MRKIFLFLVALFAMNAMATEGALNGIFSVSANKKVVFSQGNLKYLPSTDTWAFCDDQTRGVVITAGQTPDSETWIGLFAWGTGNNPTNKSEDDKDFPAFNDWGANKISNGGNKEGLWRTLSQEEWDYLFKTRADASSKYAVGTITGNMPGMIILPDDFTLPEGLTFKSGVSSIYGGVAEYKARNNYTVDEWEQMEAAGAVFLPANGNGASYNSYGIYERGAYWSSTPCDSVNAYYLLFYSNRLQTAINFARSRYCSVRLVQDLPSPDSYIDNGVLPGKFGVNADGDSIQFAQGNLQYNKYEAWWQFAENQYDILRGANKYISDIDDAEHQVIDLFGWGTSGYNGKSPTMTSTTNTDYGDGATNDIAGTPYDWAVAASEDMSLDGDWRTLTVDEWHYIINTRPNAAQLKAKATVVGQTGLILLPDNWDIAARPLNTTDNDYAANVFTQAQWIAWEAQGAVFLPSAGYRAGTTYTKQTNETDFGAYWSSSNALFPEDNPNYGQAAMVLFIDWSSVAGLSSGRRSRGYSVRLVRTAPPIAYHKIILPELEHGYVTVFDVLSGHMLSETERDSIPDGTILSVRAVPDEGYSFDKWNAPWSAHYTAQEIYPFEVGLIPGDYTFAPTFKAGEYTVAVTADPTEACQITCTTTGADLSAVPYNTQLTFALETAAGYKMRGVAGNSECIATLNETTLILNVTKNITLSLIFEHIATGIEETESGESKVKSQKILRDGQLLIIRDGKTYNALGMKIK